MAPNADCQLACVPFTRIGSNAWYETGPPTVQHPACRLRVPYPFEALKRRRVGRWSLRVRA
ncbi:hypothetical protein TRAPUB_6577 [Trametes pubescens]|uniref:Uncharacterized protein n=1 Tax=Trametes pubescens TaxID=154538 RepID=A0A1M2V5U0_TRAPU|nr:hypothetical protein TRAPUB_6577 [Trametes pubescens]